MIPSKLDMIEIPDDKQYPIREVAQLFSVGTHVLRHWEKEYDEFSPRKTATNQRSYSKKDLEIIWIIKYLLYEQKFTAAGAAAKLTQIVEQNLSFLEVQGLFEQMFHAYSLYQKEEARPAARSEQTDAQVANYVAQIKKLESQVGRLTEQYTTAKREGEEQLRQIDWLSNRLQEYEEIEGKFQELQREQRHLQEYRDKFLKLAKEKLSDTQLIDTLSDKNVQLLSEVERLNDYIASLQSNSSQNQPHSLELNHCIQSLRNVRHDLTSLYEWAKEHPISHAL